MNPLIRNTTPIFSILYSYFYGDQSPNIIALFISSSDLLVVNDQEISYL